MNFLTLVASLLAIGVVMAAGTVACRGGWPEELERGLTFEDELKKVPDPVWRARLARAARQSGRSLEASLGRSGETRRVPIGPLLGLAALHVQAAVRFLPLAGGLLFSAAAMGLAAREEKRARMSYSSATLSYAGKIVFALSCAGFLWTGVSPLGPSPEFLFVFALSAALGVYLYLSQLPPKI